MMLAETLSKATTYFWARTANFLRNAVDRRCPPNLGINNGGEGKASPHYHRPLRPLRSKKSSVTLELPMIDVRCGVLRLKYL